MPDVEFKLTGNALAVVQDATLDANFDECAAALREMMAPYASLVVTEDGVSAAKADRAKIRKVASRIDETRKEVKKAYQAPLTAFEARCKELTGICDEAAGNLDNQVKNFERQQKDAKIAEIKSYFEANVSDDAKPYLPWEAVFEKKWENATVTVDRAKLDVDTAVERCEKELYTIREMKSPFEAALLDTYRETHDLGAVIRKEQTLKAIEDSRKALRQEAAKRSGQRTAEQGKVVPFPEREDDASEGEEAAQPKLWRVTFECVGTREQLMALSQYMKDSGITYRKA